MTPRTVHRGAVVSVRSSDICAWTEARVSRDFLDFQAYTERGNGLTSDQLAAFSKPSRQRRKGPIIRFGRKS